MPDGIHGDFYVLSFTDSNADAAPQTASSIDPNLPGVNAQSSLQVADRPVVEKIRADEGPGNGVEEFQDEGNNITATPLAVTLANPPDLRVASISIPERTRRGQSFELNYTVRNFGGGATALRQGTWDDLVYLSRDPLLDLRADRFVASFSHDGGLGSASSYTIDENINLPADLIGPYYVIVVTDPVRAPP